MLAHASRLAQVALRPRELVLREALEDEAQPRLLLLETMATRFERIPGDE